MSGFSPLNSRRSFCSRNACSLPILFKKKIKNLIHSNTVEAKFFFNSIEIFLPLVILIGMQSYSVVKEKTPSRGESGPQHTAMETKYFLPTTGN